MSQLDQIIEYQYCGGHGYLLFITRFVKNYLNKPRFILPEDFDGL